MKRSNYRSIQALIKWPSIYPYTQDRVESIPTAIVIEDNQVESCSSSRVDRTG